MESGLGKFMTRHFATCQRWSQPIFSKLNQGLYSTTFLSYGGKGQFFQGCLMSGHSHEECALHPNQAMTVVHVREAGGSRGKEDSWLSKGQECKKSRRGACFAWNDGRCRVPFCKISHICSRCGSWEHKRPLCHARSGEPDIKRGENGTVIQNVLSIIFLDASSHVLYMRHCLLNYMCILYQ